MKYMGIFGTSGLARECADVVFELGYEPLFVARDASEQAACGGIGRVIVENEVDNFSDVPFVIGIGDSAVRQRVYQRYADKLTFPSVIHPSATFGRGQRDVVMAARGVVITAGVRMTNNIRVGNFVLFNLNCTVGHDCIIEDFVTLSPAANISGNVHIGARTWIGSSALINQGSATRKLHVGNDTMIGSGAVVIRDCDPNATYVGIPAKRIK